MNGIPTDIDWSFLVGHEVNQICIGPFDVIIRAGDLTVSIWATFDHVRAGQPLSLASATPDRAVTLISLLQSTIASFAVPNDRTLTLFFSNGEELRLHDDAPMFEAFSIAHGDRITIV